MSGPMSSARNCAAGAGVKPSFQLVRAAAADGRIGPGDLLKPIT